MIDTIFALSSGAPPAAIAIIRVSGPAAHEAARRLAGPLQPIRQAVVRALRYDGDLLDQAMIIAFRAPSSATGEDLVELHLHGGRATLAAVARALDAMPDVRPAEPGEFTRRALENGKLDLTQVEGLADLLAAETDHQRRGALAALAGGLTSKIERWREQLVNLSASLEAAIDFADEDDVAPWDGALLTRALQSLLHEIAEALASPPAERLRHGVRVVLAGPPNAGKSTLLNALVAREAAITSPIAGTTRDVIEVPVDFDGSPVVFVDTAGLNTTTNDPIEAIGIDRARQETQAADVLLWLSPEQPPVANAQVIRIDAKSDLNGKVVADRGIAVSALTGAGMGELRLAIRTAVESVLPSSEGFTLNLRQRNILQSIEGDLREAAWSSNLLIAAENLRSARAGFDRMTGRAGVEAMLDALFSSFCIGK